jgi:uncharacterized membrane protein YeaQ/YmgE (transglycosylase-associated protein family)
MLFVLLYAILIGAIAGWIATKLVGGFSSSLGTNIVVGMVGAALARFVLPKWFIGQGLISGVIYATLGAIILLVLIRLIKRG